MKTLLICLLATNCVCDATFLSLLAGKGGANHAASYSNHGHGQYQSHGFGNSPKVINVILDQGHSGAHTGTGDYSSASGHSYTSSGYGHGGKTKIYKVISHNLAAPAPVQVDHGYSASTNPSYAASGFNSFTSQFNAILPQILELILADDGDHGGYNYGTGSSLSPQLTEHFGHSGIAFIRRSSGKSNSYYSSGHVVEKGVLEITRVEGAPIRGPPAQVFSSHNPPPAHGW